MPRFHFNVHDGRSSLDAEGVELPDLDAARVTAVRHTAEILRDEAARIAFDDDWRMEVADDTGLVLLRVTLQVSEAPFVECMA